MKKIVALIAVISAFFLAGCTKADEMPPQNPRVVEQKFIAAGSGANIPIISRLVEAYEKTSGIKIEVPKSIGTKGAINAVQEGAIDLGLASTLLNQNEKNMGLKEIPYARVGIVVGVNPNVPDNNITYTEMVSIFKGEKTSWQNGVMIVVLSREDGDSTNTSLGKEIPGFAEALAYSYQKKLWEINYTDAEEAQAIMDTPFSIGFTDTGALAVMKLKIKPLMVSGEHPNIENVKNGSYRLFKDLYFIYKEPLSARAQNFLKFVFSNEGEQLISDNGGIPLKGRQ